MAKKRTYHAGIVRTDYAVRHPIDGWFFQSSATTYGYDKSFARATLFRERPDARFFPGSTIVDVRCRPLSTRTRASKKRTR